MILTLCVTVPTLAAKTPATTLTTGENTYTVSAVPGDYILTVTKDGCVSRTYEITLTEEATVLSISWTLPCFMPM